MTDLPNEAQNELQLSHTGNYMMTCVIPKSWNVERNRRSLSWKFVIAQGLKSVSEDRAKEVYELQERVTKMAALIREQSRKIWEIEQEKQTGGTK